MKGKPLQLIGQRFGRLTVLSKAHGDRWETICDCGNKKLVRGGELIRGSTKSCGCITRERPNGTTHGMSKTPTYKSWSAMLARTTPHAAFYERYAGRGIVVCERWRRSFDNFLADMGERPAGTTIDRIDNDKGYEPGNCRWATKAEQNRNKRNLLMVTAQGQTKCVAEWCRVQGLPQYRVYKRIEIGWSPEAAIELELREFQTSRKDVLL